MELSQRKRIRLAEKIHDQLRLLQGHRYSEVLRRTASLRENLEQIRNTSGLLTICMGRNWSAAAEQMTARLVENLRDVPYLAGEVQRMVETRNLKPPTIRDILAELQQTQDEFPGLKHVEDGDLLVVTTEAIVLDGYYLGEFEIRLEIGSLSEFKRHGAIYRVVAIDPHPAACNESVTHPHVSDEHMCEGDAGAAIEAALTNGRLCDFFQLVTAVLTNYNPNSPYVALSDWEGQQCHDCGYSMSADDSHWCSSCEEDYCDSCISFCRVCDESTCRECLDECTACGELVCPSCRVTCPECGEVICKTCQKEQKCSCVQEPQEQQENNNDPEHAECTITAGNCDDATDNAARQVGTEVA